MNLFVYGTLLVPAIWDRVTGWPGPRSIEATLSGHRIHRVRDADFPAIVEDPDADRPVPGRVIFDVPAGAMESLDSYEDLFYERVGVEVETATELVSADVYRLLPNLETEILSEDGWTLEWFLEHAYPRYWDNVFG